MLRKSVLVVAISMAVAANTRCDTLFRNRQPLKIGHGRQDGSTIIWTDCNGKNQKTYDQPPYSLDPADNCTVGPPAFGLQCDGETCTVIDQDKTSKYIAGVRNGDKAMLRITEQMVTLTAGKTTIVLER